MFYDNKRAKMVLGEIPGRVDRTGRDTDDRLNGNGGNDRIFGRTGHDLLFGGDGDDRLKGGAGNDRMVGGRGDDVLIGGKGNDTLKGQAGADIFVFAPHEGKDLVRDFQIGTDRLDLTAFDFATRAAARKAFAELGTETDNKILFEAGGTKVVIKGLDLTELENAAPII